MSTKRKYRSYTKEFKASVLKRLEQPTTDTITSISEELEIPRTTIYQWIKKKEEESDKSSTKHKPSHKWNSKDKFHVVLETATFTESELSEYCRRKGIYVDAVIMWKEQCIKANQTILEDPKELKESLKKAHNKTKELKRELRIKDKALAETAALLVLRKKANAIWGDLEEE